MHGKEVPIRWLLAVLFHLVLYQSAGEMEEDDVIPPWSGNTSSCMTAPAKRVVLVIIEGLRYDNFVFQTNKSGFPMRGLDFDSCVVGWLEAVPGEEYLGLKTMASGVLTTNVSERDHIFRRNKVVYVGSPSVPAVFSASWEARCYPEEWEDYMKCLNQTIPDEWVFTEWRHLFLNESLQTTLNTEGLIMFVYLSGVNRASQLNGPFSEPVLREIEYIFEQLALMKLLIANFYGDDKTAFVVTADYGFGGNRYVQDFIVPFVAWGSGLNDFRFPRPELLGPIAKDRGKKKMHLGDLAPVLASLIGAPIPSSSRGIAPSVIFEGTELQANVSFCNAEQLVNLFEFFEDKLSFGCSRNFAPTESSNIKEFLATASNFLNIRNHKSFFFLTQELMRISNDGIQYYRQRKMNTIWICCLLSMCGWLTLSFGWIVSRLKLVPAIQPEMVAHGVAVGTEATITGPSALLLRYFGQRYLLFDLITIIVLGLTLGLLYLISAPVVTMPSILLLTLVVCLNVRHIREWKLLYSSIASVETSIQPCRILIMFMFLLAFVYFVDYPVGVHIIFAIAIVSSSLTDFWNFPYHYVAYWTLSSLPVLALLGSTVSQDLPNLWIAALIWISTGVVLIRCKNLDFPLLVAGFVGILIIAIHAQYRPLTADSYMILGWAPTVLIFFVPLIGAANVLVRLAQLSLCLAIPVFLLSLNFEPFNFLIILNHIFSWLLLEGYGSFSELESSTIDWVFVENAIVWADARRNLYYLGYTIISFLVLGNSYDVSSWSKGWTKYFSPETDMQVLLLICVRSLPVMIAVHLAGTLIERRNPIGAQALFLHFACYASLTQMAFFWSSQSNLYIQLVLLLAILTKPLAYVFLAPSVYSLLINPVRTLRIRVTPVPQRPSHQEPIVETAL